MAKFNSESGAKHGKKTSRKGIPNKITQQFKDLLTETYQALEKDKERGLKKWAEKNPTDFYRICAKLVPQQITGEGGGPIEVIQTYILPDGTKIEF